MLHGNDVPGGCWGESHDSPFFLQNVTIFVVHAPPMFFKCFVHLLHEFDVSSLSRQGSNVTSDAKLDYLA